MKDFYIVLPSNVPANDDVTNKTSCYRTYFPSPLELNEQWEVALVQINYPHSWFNVSGIVSVIKLKKNSTNHANPIFSETDVEIPSKYYETVEELVKAIDGLFKRLGMKSTIEISPTDKVILKIYPLEGVKFHRILAAMLGFQKRKFYNPVIEQYVLGTDPIFDPPAIARNKRNTEIYVSEYKSDLRIAQYNIYVYCDILKLTLVGDTYVPLLHSIAIDDSPGKYISKEFLNPHYIPLQYGFISNIQIRLCDDIGENIRFEWGKVIVKLHFRQSQ